MSIHFDFEGRVVLITGGARGIGFSLSNFFAGAGATVAVLDSDSRALADATGELERAKRASSALAKVPLLRTSSVTQV